MKYYVTPEADLQLIASKEDILQTSGYPTEEEAENNQMPTFWM